MKLYRDEKQNSAELLEVLNKCDTISYNRRKNTFTFYAHEGALLEDVENADNMDLVKLANALDKRYFYEATIGCSSWNWDDEDEKQEDEPKAEDQATETKKEDKHMKKRFFYLADIDSTFAVTPMTKKEIISIGQELKELCAFISDDQTISGYTKDGSFFYYDNSNFDSFKKSDIINAVSVIYSDESGDYYWGGFDINEWGVAGPTEDGSTIIADHENIKEVDSEDNHEPTAEELVEAVNELCERTANSRAEVDQMIEETENMMKEQAEALQAAAETMAAEETDEEQNEEIDKLIADEIEKEFNEQNTAKENTMFFQELVSARDYFIRSAAGYVTGTKYERDINGDFWGARQCEILMSNINRAINNCNVSYKRLAEDFEHLAEMFAEISDKYDGNEDERTVSEIIYEYTRYFPELGTKAMYR